MYMKRRIVAYLLLLMLLLAGCRAEGESPVADPTPDQTENKESEAKMRLLDMVYELGTIGGATGADAANTSRFRTAQYIKLQELEAVSVTEGYYLTWFAYDKDYRYLGNGSNVYPALPEAGVWLEEGQDVTAAEILKWNADAVYLRFAVKKASGQMSLQTDVAASGIQVYAAGYPGDADYKQPALAKVGSIATDRQDCAVYGGYLFSFDHTGVCKVYATASYAPVAQFTLDKNDLISPHANAVCFGKDKYSEEDEFPLLYCNVYNTYKNDRALDGTCNVYRLQRNGTTFSTTLVQVIKVGFTGDTEHWASPDGDRRPFGNFVVDTDKQKLYAFTMRDADKTMRFFAFDLPTLADGTPDAALNVNKVTLSLADVKESFSTAYFNYVQGATYYGGRIYSLEGFGNDDVNKPALQVIDLAAGRVERKLDLYGMNFKTEPEAIYVLDGRGYFMDAKGHIYEFPLD